MLDLDDFKTVNDRLGHQAGDDAPALSRRRDPWCLPRVADRVFRYGGDEFTVICPATDAAGALALAERIRSASRPSLADCRGPRSRRPACRRRSAWQRTRSTGPTPDEVLLAADRACFVAKRRGRAEIATADEGLALAGELALQAPTPFDPLEPVDVDGPATPPGDPA